MENETRAKLRTEDGLVDWIERKCPVDGSDIFQ